MKTHRDASALRRPLIRLILASAAVGVTVYVAAWFAAAPLVRLAYAGGRLAPAEIDLLAKYITYYTLAVPPALVGFAAGRALVARAHQKSLLFGALATVLTSIACNLVFLKIGLPAEAVVFASVCGYAASALLLTALALADFNHVTTH